MLKISYSKVQKIYNLTKKMLKNENIWPSVVSHCPIFGSKKYKFIKSGNNKLADYGLYCQKADN